MQQTSESSNAPADLGYAHRDNSYHSEINSHQWKNYSHGEITEV